MMPTIFGAVTGKHGVGIEKFNSMCVQFSPQENAHMFGIKRAVDPLGLRHFFRPGPCRSSDFGLAGHLGSAQYW